MSDVVLVAIITATPSIILGTLNLMKIEKVHKATNSLTFRLVEETAASSHARGMKDQRDQDEVKIEVK